MDIFSKIAAGEIPSYKCAENDEFYAFLDINPLVKGHTLVIPRREVDYIFDMDDDELARYQVFAKRVALAVKKAFPCKKVAQVVLGLEVPHAHIHLIPMQSEADVDFRREKLKLSKNLSFLRRSLRLSQRKYVVSLCDYTNSSPYLILTSFTYFFTIDELSLFLQMSSTPSSSATM